MNTMLKTLALTAVLTGSGFALSQGAFAETATEAAPAAQGVNCPAPGAGMGPGARGPAMHGPRGWGMMAGKRDPNRVLTVEQIRTLAQAHLIMMNNDNLKVGKITETANKTYDVQIVTKENSLVNTVEVSKATGMPVR
jgi:hypothetical protein